MGGKSTAAGTARPWQSLPPTLQDRARARWLAGCLSFAVAAPAGAFEPRQWGSLSLTPELNTRLGLQYGEGINFGLGAFDAIGETERATLYLVVKPRLDAALDLGAAVPGGESEVYGGVSVVAATTTLDGEISGQMARAGDEVVDTDHAFVGWRNEIVDLSVGGQEFWVGDGFVIGDGNFNRGGENGQFWTGGFAAWRNSAVLRLNTRPLRADAFWLRSDKDFRDARVVGANVETTAADTYGVLGVMYLEVLQGGAFNYSGINAWNVRGTGIKHPAIPNLELYGEWILQLGTDEQGGGRPNEAVGWYIEGQYTFAGLPWKPRVSYRHVRLSGDEAGTPENEEYRGLFFTIFKRDWDTWYQGEIAGEYHLFNQNQVTRMFKIKAFPQPQWALTFYYYRHALEEPHYFATPTSSTDWADEINFGVEHFVGKRFYGYAGIAWSTPDSAAEEVLGDEDFTVIQTYLSFTF
jgi:hypothetical protein